MEENGKIAGWTSYKIHPNVAIPTTSEPGTPQIQSEAYWKAYANRYRRDVIVSNILGAALIGVFILIGITGVMAFLGK